MALFKSKTTTLIVSIISLMVIVFAVYDLTKGNKDESEIKTQVESKNNVQQDTLFSQFETEYNLYCSNTDKFILRVDGKLKNKSYNSQSYLNDYNDFITELNKSLSGLEFIDYPQGMSENIKSACQDAVSQRINYFKSKAKEYEFGNKILTKDYDMIEVYQTRMKDEREEAEKSLQLSIQAIQKAKSLI